MSQLKDQIIVGMQAQISRHRAEIEKLSPLVEIVSNQKQRIQQPEQALRRSNDKYNRYVDRNEKRNDLAKAEIENQQAEIIRLKSVIQQAIDNFGCRTEKFDKLLPYAKQELEVRQLMDGLKDEE